MIDLKTEMAERLCTLRGTNPLVHHITNYVTVNDCANVTLAIGASPIMADDAQEAGDIAAIASALVINMGTLNTRTVESMMLAGASANRTVAPVIFDPVGAGASDFRSTTAQALLNTVKMSVIRGNASEIGWIGGLGSAPRGVDAADGDGQNLGALKELAAAVAAHYNCTVAITGAVDVISDGEQTVTVHNGHPMLSGITGTGCMSTSLVGSYCAIGDKHVIGAAAAIATMGIAGEIAYEKAGAVGNGSFRVAMIDAISKMDRETLSERVKLGE